MARTPASTPHTQTARREAYGTVEKLPSGRYRAYYRADGERFTGPGTFATKTDAQSWIAVERAKRYQGIWHDRRTGQRTLEDYATQWLTDRRKLSPRTRDLYEHYLARWILPRMPAGRGRGVELGKLTLTAITPEIVRSWHAQVTDAARESALARMRSTGRAHPARAWGRAHGYDVKAQGLMSPALLAAWLDAGSPTVVDAAGLEDAHPDAGKTAPAQAYALLHSILATAAVDELITANPCRIEGAAVRRPRERRVASPAEVATITMMFPEHLRAAVTLAAWSGLRYGELFGMARRHVDLNAGTLRVEGALVIRAGHPPVFGATKTAASRRTVHLPPSVVDELRTHMARHVAVGPRALLFTELSGAPITPSRLSTLMRKACAAIDRDDLTWHDLRHTGATLAYSIGASVREVQNRLGHATGRAAAIYQHASDDSDRLIADRLDTLRLHDDAPVIRLSAP